MVTVDSVSVAGHRKLAGCSELPPFLQEARDHLGHSKPAKLK